jgi:hypothetical protein
VVLKRANHFQSRAIANVGEPWISVATEISLQDSPILRAVKERSPRFKFANAIGRFLGMQFRHAPIVDVLAAAHCVGEVHFPIVTLINVCKRRSNSTLGHYCVRFAQKGLANKANANACSRRFNRGAQPCPARANYENVVLESFVVSHA